MVRSADTVADRLAEIIGAEIEALRRGGLHEVALLADEKAKLVAELSALSIAPDTARRLRRIARENLVHLDAARRGIRAARLRVEGVLRTARGLDTYDREGRPQVVGSRPGAVERRV